MPWQEPTAIRLPEYSRSDRLPVVEGGVTENRQDFADVVAALDRVPHGQVEPDPVAVPAPVPDQSADSACEQSQSSESPLTKFDIRNSTHVI